MTLEDALAQAEARAAAVAEEEAPTTADLEALAHEGEALVRLTGDIAEVAAAMLQSGLALPTADLPAELDDLTGRAAAAGLRTATRLLGRLGATIEVLRAAEAPADRSGGMRAAWEALQALVCWVRLFRAELDLLRVEATLQGPKEAVAPDRAARAPGADADVWVAGAHLDRDRLTLYGIDLRDRSPVLLIDRLAEHDSLDPLGTPIISRLFQDRVPLGQVLDGIVQLRDQRVGARQGTRAFFPDFRTRPTIRRLKAGERPPALRQGRPGRAPRRVAITIAHRPAGVAVGVEGAMIALAPAARLAFTKLLIREGVVSLQREAAAVRVAGQTHLLMVDDALEGRCHPGLDPRAFPLRAPVLARRVSGSDPLPRAALALHGPVELGSSLAERPPSGVLDELRIALLARRLGLEPTRPGLADRVAATLATSTDPSALAAALWLADGDGRGGDLARGAVTRLPGLGETAEACARALILAGDGTEPGPALALLEAHVHALQAALRVPDQPLPAPLDLVLLGEVLDRLRGAPPGPVVASFALPVARLWAAVSDPLLPWLVGQDGGLGVARRAADALLLAEAAGIADVLFAIEPAS